MELHTCGGFISFSADRMIINCQVKDLNNVFKELFKLIPRDTKIKDVKTVMSNKISICLS